MKGKRIVFAIMFILFVLFVITEVKAENEIENTTEPETVTTEIKLISVVDKLEKDTIIPVQIYVKNDTKKLEAFDVLLEYDENMIYELDEDSFVPNVDMDIFYYQKEDKNLQIILKNPISEGVIATVNIKLKQTLPENGETTQVLKMYDIFLVTDDYNEEQIDSVIGTVSKENELYLHSDTYKIGNNDINNYEDGDKYIYRVAANTTLDNYIRNLSTNGDIKVIKSNGTELTSNELVGTSMTLVVTKGDKRIELKIAVIGDLSGDGKVTAQDLSTLSKTTLGLITLNDEYKLAADIEENDKITATDLSAIRQMI